MGPTGAWGTAKLTTKKHNSVVATRSRLYAGHAAPDACGGRQLSCVQAIPTAFVPVILLPPIARVSSFITSALPHRFWYPIISCTPLCYPRSWAATVIIAYFSPFVKGAGWCSRKKHPSPRADRVGMGRKQSGSESACRHSQSTECAVPILEHPPYCLRSTA
jgi:hypothetical protein